MSCCLLLLAVSLRGSDQTWWSFAPIKTPPIPAGDPSFAQTPVDHFISQRLRQKGLTPSSKADKRTLLRRVYYDLIGLPPSPEEIRSFLANPAPDALSRVIEQLLASPRYGERWARHWLDVVHYAETHGHDQDRPRTNSWPYRDYVVASFNADKPFGLFAQEQIAGDVLFPDDPQATVALGFLATGPWDESSLRDIRDDSIDRQIARYLDRDDIVTTVMNTFVSVTVQCARCHDHKFDPVSQEEYYNLQAVFAATDKADRTFDAEPAVHRRRQALLRERREGKWDLADLRAWETSMREKAVSWIPLESHTLTSSNGVTLKRQLDNAILSSGPRPETDTYVVHAVAPMSAITAVRLEVLAHDSLPMRGPGRQDNGNLHLTDFQLAGVQFKRAVADFNQKDWDVSKAIDSDPRTAWGIYPAIGKSHEAIFELNSPLSASNLVFTLDQRHGGGHLIGCFRLSVTTSAPPVSLFHVPAGFHVPVAQRTPAQEQELGAFFLRDKVDRALAALPAPRFVYAGASDFVPDGSFKPAISPRPVHLLKRGDIHRPGDPAQPGALRCIDHLPSELAAADEGHRRAALARWITHRENPLTWRSIVNRAWHYHFGRGLVDTPNDLGRMGSQPSHPELLDWLAAAFRDSGGSMKQLHRLILNSAVYQQSSLPNDAYAQVDAANVYLWRMNRTRLDAESIRDAVLALTGQLDLKMGGPSVQQFVMSPGIHVTPVVDYAKFDVDSPANRRRSIYRFIFRTLPDPFMDALDCADPSQLTPVRNVSVTPLQALAMLNNHFLIRQSEHFAARLGNDTDPVGRACELAWGRPPNANEAAAFGEYVREHGLANFCRVLLNSNEFMFVH